MSIFNPYVLLGIAFAVLSAFGGGYWKGKDAEHQRQQIEIARLNQEARETEQRMAEVANTYAQTLRKANNVAKVKEDKLRADIADGALKLRIPVKTTMCPVSATADAAPASGDNSGTAELQPETAKDILAIGDDADQTVRKLNACIQAYNEVRESLSKGVK